MRPVVTALALTVMLSSAGCATAPAASEVPAAPAEPPLRLVFFHPFRPGVLAQCEHVAGSPGFEKFALPDPRDPQTAWAVEGPFSIRWAGGVYRQLAPASTAADLDMHAAIGHCFAILSGGQPFVWGAVLPEYSARLLRFPVLVRMRAQLGEPAKYELRPGFPGGPADTVPSAWSVLGRGQ